MNNKKTIFIVGANSMIGSHVVELFAEDGWNVFAGVTNKSKLKKPISKAVTLIELNLERTKSIYKAVKKVLKNTSKIDVLINAAGLVYSGPLESFSQKKIQKLMDVNFFGVVNTIQAFLPAMREMRAGVIVNVSSICGLAAFPMLSLYHASKWALEGMSESLYYELDNFGIKVKIVEPGGVKEEGETTTVEFPDKNINDYDELMERVHNSDWFPSFSTAREVAEIVFFAAKDPSNKLRYIIGEETFNFVDERKNFIRDENYLFKMKQRIINK